MAITIGVLALQGDFVEHMAILEHMGINTVAVRNSEQLVNINGLIIPGGESTTIGRLMHERELYHPILECAARGIAIWGTCAGAILLAERGSKSKYKNLGLIDITIMRNAFGRQIDSFVTELNFKAIGGKPFSGVFIRAPIITEVGSKAKALITLDDGTIVAAEQDRILVTSFHPELTKDNRFHKYFLQLVQII